ncbi:hypothetical protein ACP4OV_022053 [Aristida adscensionis]
MGSVSLLLLLLFFSMSISTLATTEADEQAALLAFKAAAISGGGNGDALASWNTSSANGFCSWEGVTCGRRHRWVVALSLPSSGLSGVLSPAIGNLSSLRVLNLSSNGFSGGIPASIGRLQRLQALNLSRNSFSGEIPSNLSSCTSLTALALRYNQLHGRIPSELGNKLTRLVFLGLGNNSLTGPIPESLANLSSLNSLYLSFNQLEGTIPPGLGAIPGLQSLALAFNNLTGTPPHSLYNLSSLNTLQIQGNMLYGVIPADIGNMFPNMLILNIGRNQFTGSIPASLSNLTTLRLLQLAENQLTGYVPPTLGILRALQHLYLYTNMLEANHRKGWEFIASLSNCSQLQDLEIGQNLFTGHIPSSIVNLSTTLQFLHLGENGVSGSIPSAISNLVSLEYLHVANTSISGVIPESIGKLGNLVKLHISNTELSGLIPSSIGNLTKLNILKARNGNLEGPIPISIGKMKNVLALDLSVNQLNGSIPKDIFKLPVLDYLSLAYNSLSGPLPFEVGRLQNLNQLLLSGNRLSGEIPDSIGECTVLQGLWLDNNLFEGHVPQSLNNIKGLTVLNLSMNKLSGTIPDDIGSIRSLQQLSMAHNNFSGPIPTILQNLTSLLELNLSFNSLQGEVPKEGIFRNLTVFSIIQNNELCGGIPQLHLAPCQMNSVKNNRKGHIKFISIAIAITGMLFLALMITFIQLIYKKLRRRQKSPLLPPIMEEQYERISYNALANGTNGFSGVNLLGKGSFGAVYKCTFEEGTIAAVKVFNLEQSKSCRSFVAECEALKRVRHRCLIKIITSCSSINHEGKEFKALVFEFMPNGNLNSWLHPKCGMPTLSNTLSLAQRLDIAVDITDALNYLHNHCQPPVIHCDVKPSNILLAEDMSARVGDFGISRILPDTASKTLQNSNSTIGIRGSIGYVAPEYGEDSSVSTLGDVYSLGILLLEMFTGRSPTDDIFQGSLNLHKFSKDALPERIWEIADPTICMHTDAYNSTTSGGIHNCLVSVISLGISCSVKKPRDRIAIEDAASEMHAIRDSYLMPNLL